MTETYRIPWEAFAEDSFVEKRSKFIGRLWHVETAEEAVQQLQKIRETYRDATHHCWAYLIREGNLIRYSDDGEPQGTAGLPILDVLRHQELTDVLCVVTRYFGGILLGKGGLVRAYTKGAQVAVAAAGIQQMRLYTILLLACPYALLETVRKLLPRFACVVENTEFGVDVTLTVSMPAGEEAALNLELAEISAGQVCAEPMETRFMGRRVE